MHLGHVGAAPGLRRAGRRLPPPASGAGEARPRGARHRGRRAGHLQRRAALRRGGPLADRRASARTGCSRGSGPSRSATASTPAISAARLAGRRDAGQGGADRPAAWWRGSATSTSARRSGGRGSRRSGWPRDVTRGGGRGAGRGGPGGARRRARRRRLVAARLPAGGRRARLLPAFLRGLRPRGRALPALRRRPSRGSCRRDGRASSARPARADERDPRRDAGCGKPWNVASAVHGLDRRASEGELPWPTRP